MQTGIIIFLCREISQKIMDLKNTGNFQWSQGLAKKTFDDRERHSLYSCRGFIKGSLRGFPESG